MESVINWTTSRLLSTACVLMAILACNNVIVDDWGPPAGYGLVEGTVSRSSGGTAIGVTVSVWQCDEPMEGHGGSARTTGSGRYAIELRLPPVGVMSGLDADTLTVSCVVVANEDSTSKISVDVPFAETVQDVLPVIVNLVIQ
jgi:hypothetical protein